MPGEDAFHVTPASFPDISSVLKLRDLYDVSLDELRKEDAGTRTRIEQIAKLPRRY